MEEKINNQLNTRGYALIPSLLTKEACGEMISLYENKGLFRKRVVMERHRFGKGEYQYFNYPLPGLITNIREKYYAALVPLANMWMKALKISIEYPASHEEFIEECHTAGQKLATPLLLRYHQDDFNCLHQDLYGKVFFPLQLVICLNQPGKDFTGGEFVLTEQKYMSQSSCEVITPQLGDAIIFATQYRPVMGAKGYYRAHMKHGVSRVRSGERNTLGIIFHDAEV
ncbi:Hypothetical protein C900_03935 [Fulvivirga imtechensis AK7]|uniref:Fe2OG dioxygenase domain-containing protein n=1 Tax=Fulvivirga imtechensis AK7 TaxID=1237149 RepID=L8JN65_9BACT|nr:2OG-Fe(II) oxygenase [Fulvivirga imtechensis]ELR70250.1 Hypothetical protein C900_03935 [Fulvivirga imtechensis AK7]